MAETLGYFVGKGLPVEVRYQPRCERHNQIGMQPLVGLVVGTCMLGILCFQFSGYCLG